MTLEDLKKRIAARLMAGGNTSISNAAVDAVLHALGDVTGTALAQGDEVPLPGIGRLKAKQRAARMGRNPKTGGMVEVPARLAVVFVPGKGLKAALNPKQEG